MGSAILASTCYGVLIGLAVPGLGRDSFIGGGDFLRRDNGCFDGSDELDIDRLLTKAVAKGLCVSSNTVPVFFRVGNIDLKDRELIPIYEAAVPPKPLATRMDRTSSQLFGDVISGLAKFLFLNSQTMIRTARMSLRRAF